MLLNVRTNRMLLEGGCDLEAMVVEHATRAGFRLAEVLRMLKPGGGGGADGGFEPIFVFRKPS